MRDERFEVTVTFDERRGYSAGAAAARARAQPGRLAEFENAIRDGAADLVLRFVFRER